MPSTFLLRRSPPEWISPKLFSFSMSGLELLLIFSFAYRLLSFSLTTPFSSFTTLPSVVSFTHSFHVFLPPFLLAFFFTSTPTSFSLHLCSSWCLRWSVLFCFSRSSLSLVKLLIFIESDWRFAYFWWQLNEEQCFQNDSDDWRKTVYQDW